MRRNTWLLSLALTWPLSPVSGQPAPDFSATELQSIHALGPWPPAPRRDPSNRVSGRPAAIELGRRLFHDARMSPIGYIACVTCHQPDRAFTDFKARAHGLADLPRNTPALANLTQQRWFGWGGSSDSLWMASIRPMLDEREFAGNLGSITKVFVRDPELAACYRRAFGEAPRVGSERTVVHIGKALAAYQETLVTTATPFDAFRDALASGDAAATGAYPAAARHGLKLFVGSAGCVACHSGANFSDGRFHPGVLPDEGMSADSGRMEGVRNVVSSRFNLLGRYNDDPKRSNAGATRRLTMQVAEQGGQFRTPSLRNVAVTAPYMHNGQVDSLAAAVGHAVKALTKSDSADLVAFLMTLTDAYGERRPGAAVSVAMPAPPCP